MAVSNNGNRTDEGSGTAANGSSGKAWPYVGEPPLYAPLSPWTRFQGGGFYVMLFTVFAVSWTLICGAGAYYGMRNVALVHKIGFWDAVRLRWDSGVLLWLQVWLYPVLATQLASWAIRLYYKRRGIPLKQSLAPGPVETARRQPD